MSTRTMRRLVGIVAAASLALTACSSADSTDDGSEEGTGAAAEGTETDDDSEAPEADGEPIRVGVITSTSGAPVSYTHLTLPTNREV